MTHKPVKTGLKKRDVLMVKYADPKKVIRRFVKTLEKLGQQQKGTPPPATRQNRR